jgi:hypothetical protein
MLGNGPVRFGGGRTEQDLRRRHLAVRPTQSKGTTKVAMPGATRTGLALVSAGGDESGFVGGDDGLGTVAQAELG